MNDKDLNDAISFFCERLRGIEGASQAQLKRWALHKLRNDAQATAELMLDKGYRAAYLAYFIKRHLPFIRPEVAGGALGIVFSDLHHAAKQLPQPYRDLAGVCFKWGYLHKKTITLLEKELRDVVET